MKKKAAAFFLLFTTLLISMSGQTASPTNGPKGPASSPKSSPGNPIVRIRLAVLCEEAAIRTLVGTSLRNELVKLPNVFVLPGNGRSSVIIGIKIVPITGIQNKTPVYAMHVSLLDVPAIYDALETAGLSRETVRTLLAANEIQPIREYDVLTFAAKDQLPAKVSSLVPQIQKSVERARLAITLNQQRIPDTQTDIEPQPRPEEAP